MRKLSLLLFLDIIILISGCIEQEIPITTTTPKDGVIIKKFWFDNSNIYEGDRAILNIELQNIGEIKATDITAKLFGGWLSDSSNKNIPLLSAAEPEVQIEGESRILKWVLTSPNVETEINYDIGTRVTYDYSTIYTGMLRLVKDVYLETLTEEERTTLLEKNGVVSSKVTGGPLSVNPVKGRNFIISSGDTDSRPIVFKLTNIGSGYPSDYEVKIDDETGFNSCRTQESGGQILKLSKGEERLFICDFDIDIYNNPNNPNYKPIINKEDIIFSVTFVYSYYVDDIASVTVNPLPEL
jgi:hypothetical protein